MQTMNVIARDVKAYGTPDLSALSRPEPRPPFAAEVHARITNQFLRWTQQVAAAKYCCRPIRLKGRVTQVDRGSGEVWTSFSTEAEPDGTLLVACGSRSASKCPSCAWWYRGDAYQVVATGLRGGKGIPATVADHPRVFATFTAPSFGAVHTRRVEGDKVAPCHRRSGDQLCPHGRPTDCSTRHGEKDPVLGTPLCPACMDIEGQVIWNAMAPELWARTRIYLPRELAKVLGVSQAKLASMAIVRCLKVAEFQKRGAVHYHAVIRVDATPPDGEPDAVAPPPIPITDHQLALAVRAARDAAVIHCSELAALGRANCNIRWGREIDVRPIGGEPGEPNQESVAHYLAKYSTKFAESLGLPATPFEGEASLDSLAAPAHIKELARTALRLGRRPELSRLKLGRHTHTLGFGGHFLTKSRRYSTTMGALRQDRRNHARRSDGGDDAGILDAWGRPWCGSGVDEKGNWHYTGWGYQTEGEGWLVATARRNAEESRQEGRWALAELRAEAEWAAA